MKAERDRLKEIAGEVMDLMDVDGIFAFLDSEAGDVQALENRLQEVMMTRQSFETIELAMYLRTASSRQARLPSWQPLLNVAIEQGLMRGDNVNDIFLGLAPPRPDPYRNSGVPK